MTAVAVGEADGSSPRLTASGRAVRNTLYASGEIGKRRRNGFACGNAMVTVTGRRGAEEEVGIHLGDRRLVATWGLSCLLVKEQLSVV